MATVGQTLTAPEAGWRRYDDTNSLIKLKGNWNRYSGTASYYNSTHSTTGSNLDSFVEFSFKGTALRLIGILYSGSSERLEVSIDGVKEEYSQNAASTIYQALNYEKTGLEDKFHQVVIKNLGTKGFYFDAIDLNEHGYLTAGIGDQLTTPEAGWKRYDDSHPAIKYGTGWSTSTGSAHYNSTIHLATTSLEKVSFKFKGTKIRLAMMMWSTGAVSKIRIDGVEEEYNQYAASQVNQALVYEKTGLEDAVHVVEIFKKDTSNTSTIDAIDIDATGSLFHPDEVQSVDELAVGKRIRCHYQATSNTVGTFSSLGKEVYGDGKNDFIPPASSAAPKGSFYYICVDKDYRGRPVLVADRAVQHSISWDTLNSAKIASGGGLPYNFGIDSYKFNVRLLTGGISSTDHQDSEWTQYIVNGPVGNGDATWNWSTLLSWTSTTVNGSNVQRVNRGLNSVSFHSSASTDTVGTNRGFRPVLVAESLFTEVQKHLIFHEGQYKKWDGAAFVSVSASPTEEEFLSVGMDSLNTIPAAALNALGEFEVATYRNHNKAPRTSFQVPGSIYRAASKDYAGQGKIVTDVEILPAGRKLIFIEAEHENCLFDYSLDGGKTWYTGNVREVIDITQKEGNELMIRVTLPDAQASIKALSYAWA